MVTVKLFIDLDIYRGLALKKNEEYVMSGAVMNQLAKMYPGSVEATGRFDSIYHPLDLSMIKEGDTVFLFRSGGIGDVMFMLPLVRYLSQKRGCRVYTASSPMYCDVFNNNPYIEDFFQMPFSTKKMEEFKYHQMFEGVIEDNGIKAQSLNAIDLFLDTAGVDYSTIDSSKKIPEIFFNDEERRFIDNEKEDLEKKHTRPFVGMQIESSSPIRMFPLEKLIAVSRRLRKDFEATIFFFGGKRQVDVGKYISEIFQSEKGFVNLVEAEMSLRDSIMFAFMMDCFVAPDSAFIHVCGGLGVPVVGLYGCFPSLLRMRYYKNAIGIDSDVKCAPSFIHGHSPCDKGFPSPCFSVISVDNVVDAVGHLLGKGKKISLMYPVYNIFENGEFVPSPFSTIKEERE